jgi:glycosyltransferase involved in cell wall biosynthesis
VVDGSPDRTLKRAEEYAAKDSRIRVYNQAHSGAGTARNYGLSLAQGEYVMFLDADDFYFPDFISRMLSAIEEKDADIAACRFLQQNYRNGNVQKNLGIEERFLGKDDVIEPEKTKYLLCAFIPVVHNRIYRKRFLLSNELQFSSTESLNDLFFSMASLICAEKIALVWDNLYIYRVYHNANSISAKRDNFRESLFTVYSDLYKWLKDKGKEDAYLDSYCRKWRGSLHNYARYGIGKDFQEKAVKFLSDEEPWVNMSGRELHRMAGLGTEAAKIRRWQNINLRKKSMPNTKEYEAADKEIYYRDCEIKNVEAIRKHLQSECTRYEEKRDHLPTAAYWRGSDFLKRCLAGRSKNKKGKKVKA